MYVPNCLLKALGVSIIKIPQAVHGFTVPTSARIAALICSGSILSIVRPAIESFFRRGRRPDLGIRSATGREHLQTGIRTHEPLRIDFKYNTRAFSF